MVVLLTELRANGGRMKQKVNWQIASERILTLSLFLVGTSRCDVPARGAAGGTNANDQAGNCAAGRGADGAARRFPYQGQCQDASGGIPAPSVAGCAARPAQLRSILVPSLESFPCARSFPRGRGKPHARRVRSPFQFRRVKPVWFTATVRPIGRPVVGTAVIAVWLPERRF